MHATSALSSAPTVSSTPTDKISGKTAPAKDQPAKAQPEPSTTVTLSSAAIAALAAQKEALETPQQTAKEARGNDHQAQRVLAKEEAIKAQQAR